MREITRRIVIGAVVMEFLATDLATVRDLEIRPEEVAAAAMRAAQGHAPKNRLADVPGAVRADIDRHGYLLRPLGP